MWALEAFVGIGGGIYLLLMAFLHAKAAALWRRKHQDPDIHDHLFCVAAPALIVVTSLEAEARWVTVMAWAVLILFAASELALHLVRRADSGRKPDSPGAE